MKRVLALAAGVLVALVPTGTAFAGEVPGKAYGNCQHSSSGGEAHTALMPDVGSGQGNGGLVELAKPGATGTGCLAGGTPVGDEPKGPRGPKPPSTEPSGPIVYE